MAEHLVQSAEVLVGGRPVSVQSVEMSRSLPDPALGGGLRSATAQVVAVEGDDLVDSVVTPWDPGTQWPPQQDAATQIDLMGARVLSNGRVSGAGAEITRRLVEFEAADLYESLNQSITWEGFAATMPGWNYSDPARYVGLRSSAVTDMILRHCGWYCTPPRLGYAMLSVPAQGTMWPEAGRVDTSVGPTGLNVSWLPAPWGIASVGADSTYTLAGPRSLNERPILELVALSATQDGEGTSRILVMAGTVQIASLTWSKSTVALYMRDGSGVSRFVASLVRQDGMQYATIERLTSTSVRVTLRSGTAYTSSTAAVDSFTTSSALTTARVDVKSRASGFQVAMPGTAHQLSGWVPNAIIQARGSLGNSLHAIPSVDGRKCADLLNEQCAAEAATYWINEDGMLEWWDLSRLHDRPVSRTLTSRDDIAGSGFSWSHHRSQVRSQVAVAWKDPAKAWSRRPTVDLWDGGGSTIEAGSAPVDDPFTEWITAPDDEVWIMPDLALSRMGDADTDFNFNMARGSFYGGIVVRADGSETGGQYEGTLTASVERVTGAAFKMSTVWTGPYALVRRAPSERVKSGIWYVRRSMSLPIIRGRAKFTFQDRVTYSTQQGPVSAPEDRVDAGWWIQRPEQAEWTANYYGARVTAPQPMVSSMRLIPTPDLRMGQTVEAVVTSPARLTVRGVVMDDVRTVSATGPATHEVSILPLYATRNGVTWAEWASVVSGDTWTDWGTRQAGTWNEWGQAPLLKEGS